MALTEQLLLVEYVAWGYPARSTARLECADRQKITARYGIAARIRNVGNALPQKKCATSAGSTALSRNGRKRLTARKHNPARRPGPGRRGGG